VLSDEFQVILTQPPYITGTLQTFRTHDSETQCPSKFSKEMTVCASEYRGGAIREREEESFRLTARSGVGEYCSQHVLGPNLDGRAYTETNVSFPLEVKFPYGRGWRKRTKKVGVVGKEVSH
jgi:hypothetical protein